jgi:acyl dehydratase
VSTKRLFWEDFAAGSAWTHGSYLVTQEEIIQFARKYDPLELHTSPERARHTPLGVFCASGVHTFGIAQRLLCEAVLLQTNVVAGGGVDDFRMRLPVVPGDHLHLKATVSTAWPHRTRLGDGWVEFHVELSRANEEIVLEYRLTVLLQRTRSKSM